MGRDIKPFRALEGAEVRAKRRKTNQRKPKAHEDRVAEAVGGKRQKGSGSHYEEKGDVARVEASFPLLIECKRTSGQKTLRIDSDWLAKITREAHARDRYPALSIEFDEEIVRALPGAPEATWVALPLSVMRGLLEKAGEDTEL